MTGVTLMSDVAERDTDIALTFLRRYYSDGVVEVYRCPRERESLEVDWMDMFRFEPDFAETYIHNPEEVRERLEDALLKYDVPIDPDHSPVNTRVRVYNIDESQIFDIGEYRPQHLGDAVSVRGQISQLTNAKMRLDLAVFQCERCGTENIDIPQTGEDLATPAACPGCERNGPFQLVDEFSERSRHQQLRLTPPPEQGSSGSEYIDVTLSGDLVKSMNGGERVLVTGELLSVSENNDSVIERFELRGNHIEVVEGNASDIDTEAHREEIERVRSSDDPIDVLKSSFAPQIVREEGKTLDALIEATILQMFGAVENDQYRDFIHVLALGDPGTAKTEVLEEAERLAPRAKFKSGRSVSGTGLTVTAVSDDFGGSQWGLKAGLLPKTSGGLACLDEIDKVPREAIMSIHSALESGRISASKAGMDADMAARTSLLAAGNPREGRFNGYDPIASQVDFPASLLSRFDLKFMLKDTPDENGDAAVSEHLAESFVAATKAATGSNDSDSPLDRDVEPEAFRAYVAKARETVSPTVENPAVIDAATEHYRNIRSDIEEDDPIPATPRNLEAVLRLAHASARARFSNTVEEEDVSRAQKLVMRSVAQMNMDENGNLDVDISETGTSKTQRDRVRKLGSIIGDLEREHDNGAPVKEVLDRAENAGIERSRAEHEIQKLRRQGDAYEPQTGHVRMNESGGGQ